MDHAERQRLMEAGRHAFNQGEFYDAHEHWEEVWNEADDPERRWVQGLIQVATGLHKLERQQRASCRTLLQKALAKLADAPEAAFGFAVGALRAEAARVLDAVGKGAPVNARDLKLELAA